MAQGPSNQQQPLNASASSASAAPSVTDGPDDATRRDSSTSTITHPHALGQEHLDKEDLDKIHTSASLSQSLTTFDFGQPPGAVPPDDAKPETAGDLVQQGLVGLYTRLRDAVGGAVGGAAAGAAVAKPSAPDTDDAVVQDTTPRKNEENHTSSAHSTSSAPVRSGPEPPSSTSLSRGETSNTASALDSNPASERPGTASAMSSSAGPATDSQPSHMTQSSKASSVTTMTASKTSAGSGAPNNPIIAKAGLATAASTSVASVTAQGRSSTQTSSGKPGDSSAHGNLSENANLDGPATSASSRSRRESRGRRDDGLSVDGSMAPPLSPVKTASTDAQSISSTRASTSDTLRKPAVIDRISFPRVSGSKHSRSSSMEPGTAEPSHISTSAHNVIHHGSFAHNERPQLLQSGLMRIPGTTLNEGAPEMVSARLESMRKQVLSKEFWMADETCNECFLCGTPFSAFRRKHHCRTCGCIFDSKCTSIISGQKFNLPGTLRVCKKCVDVINRRYEDMSDDSADESSYIPAIFRPHLSTRPMPVPVPVPVPVPSQVPRTRADDEVSVASLSERTETVDDSRSATTPMMAIPATRTLHDNNRQSAILEIDMPKLSRPSSARSLRSLAAAADRPQSSGHRRHHSRHNFFGRFKAAAGAAEESAPFRRSANDEMGKKAKLPAFHDDNMIDPDLAPYMSDESSGDEQMSSLFAAMNSNDMQAPANADSERAGLGPYLTAGRKGRFRHGDKSVSGMSFTSRGAAHEEGGGGGLPNLTIHTRPPRRRNLSTASASVHHLRSPRPKSGVFKGYSMSAETLSLFENAVVGDTPTGSDSNREEKLPELGLALSSVGMRHMKRLLRQLLNDAQVPHPSSWERALIPILLRCADDVNPRVPHGDDMDIRHYVKLKKIPGGKPSDTTFVNGIVFTKNLALKSMPRKIHNSRIVIVTFPIEYQRHQEQQHFMSLQPVIEQEKEYLRMVINRILNLRPHVLLVEKNVSGVALQYLVEASVAVAYNVKPSVITAVARIADTFIISSVDMLSFSPHVGTSGSVEVKTFVNHELKGKKKTYIFISGCNKELGCTIALRGASRELLARVKRITEFMVYVVYNLKLESALMRDECIRLPNESPLSTTKQSTDESALMSPTNRSTTGGAAAATQPCSSVPPASQNQPSEPEKTTQPPNEASGVGGDLQQQTASSRTAEFAAEQTMRLMSLNNKEHNQATHGGQVLGDVPTPVFYSDMVARFETRVMSASPFVKFAQPYLLERAREQERRLVYLRRLRDQDVVGDHSQAESVDDKPKQERFQLIRPEMVHEMGQKAPRHVMEVLHAVHDAEYDKALHNYQTQTRQWDYTMQNSQFDIFDPYAHQNIVVLYSVTCTATKIPCTEPHILNMEFYDEHADSSHHEHAVDCTLGQYIEDLYENADAVCLANGCGKKMHEHHRTYVHDHARITVIVEANPTLPESLRAFRLDDDDNLEKDWNNRTGVIMWNYCKVCNHELGIRTMSMGTWKYSFGKYLELAFWSVGMRLDDSLGCPHDHQKDHVRFFLHGGIVIRIHYDPIDLYEVIVPRARMTWKVEHDLRLKNDIFTKTEERWTRFMNSVHSRLQSIRVDSVLPEKAEACRAEVDRLTKQAQAECPEVMRELEDAYMNSKYYEVIPLNTVMREMVSKAEDWDLAFEKLEADFLSNKDVRQLTIMQLKKIWSDNESKESLAPPDGTVSLASESDGKATPMTVSQTTGTSDEMAEKSTQVSECEPNSALQNSASSALQNSASSVDDAPAQSPVLVESSSVDEVATAESSHESSSKPEVQAPAAAPTSTVPQKGNEASTEPTSQNTNASSEQTAESAVVLPDTGSLKADAPDARATASEPALGTEPALSTEPASSVDPAPSVPQKTAPEKSELFHREQRTASVGNTSDAGGPSNDTGTNRSSRKGPNMPPPLGRAVTQPPGSLPKAQTSGKLLKEQRIQASGDNAKTANTKSVDGGSASVKSPGGEKSKFTDRIAMSALKAINPRKAVTSGIPRYVHGKSRESKVSTLARHFEQLSREFEKERLRDRKQRAAKTSSNRAVLPRSSTKAIVEVYQDVDQAVREPGPSDEDHLLNTPKEAPPQLQMHDHRPWFEKKREDTRNPRTAKGRQVPGTMSGGYEAPPIGIRRADEEAETTAAPEPEAPPPKPQAPSVTEGAEGDDFETRESQVPSDVDDEDEDDGVNSDADRSSSLKLDDIVIPTEVTEIAESLESEESGSVGDIDLPKHQKKSLMTMLSKFWAERSASGWPKLEYPLNSTDHIFTESDVIVREDEPSSLIAYTLDNDDYKTRLAEFVQEGKAERPNMAAAQARPGAGMAVATPALKGTTPEVPQKAPFGGSSNNNNSNKDDDRYGPYVPSSPEEANLWYSLLRPTSKHFRYQYTDGPAKFMCKIFYAEQFDALRRKCGVQDRIVESLSRCLKWDSKGGKTKSVFLKTLDDRLVIKSLSPVETTAFLQFAPAYFQLMGEALFRDMPTVIAKMFGFYQITIRNPQTAVGATSGSGGIGVGGIGVGGSGGVGVGSSGSTDIRLDLLVMENLFYDRSPARTFDLKGSMRNRRIQSTGERDEVLLDENMVEYIYESPLFAREHSKRQLRLSVYNDTLFLSRQNVMDYSLMVAVDEERKELCVGIIDCIRTYTWDKRLESWIKDRGFAGGGRSRPTVTSPKEYKSRFREAMQRYILQAPNCWHRFTTVMQPVLTQSTPKPRFEEMW